MVREDRKTRKELNMSGETTNTVLTADAPTAEAVASTTTTASTANTATITVPYTTSTTYTIDAPPQESAEIAKLKAALSKANAEAAEWRRKLNARQTEQEIAEQERAEREKARDARLAELEAKERILNYKEKLLDAGYDAATADAKARSLPPDLGDEYFAAEKNFFEKQREAMQADALKNQSGLSVGMPPSADQAKKAELNKLRGYAGLPPLP